MSVVDDYGRYYADPGMLHAACYPRQLNKVSDSDIGKWLTACVNAALVRVYPAKDGESYLQLLDFGQQVRAKKSKYPGPLSECLADAEQLQSNAHLDVSVSVFGDVGVPPAAPDLSTPKKKKSIKTGLPEGFCVSDGVKKWAKEKGFGQLEQHLESFVSKCKAKGYSYVDWDEALMNAIRDDWAKLRVRFQSNDPSVTVPAKPGVDPALAKCDADRLTCKGPPPEIRSRMKQLTGARR